MPQLGDHREAVLARQHHIQHHQVEAALPVRQQPERALTAVDDFHVVALGFEIEAQPRGQVLLVFYNQYPAHCGGAMGSCRVNVLPRPAPGLSA